MKCPQCKLDIGEDSKFCKECGTNISSLKEASPAFTKTLETPFKFIDSLSLTFLKEMKQ